MTSTRVLLGTALFISALSFAVYANDGSPAEMAVLHSINAEAANGSATTEITFTEPGEYQLQVRAFDGGKSTYEFVTVNVE